MSRTCSDPARPTVLPAARRPSRARPASASPAVLLCAVALIVAPALATGSASPATTATTAEPTTPAPVETIADVLRRSQHQRLDALPPADANSPAAARVMASFERLIRVTPPRPGQCQPTLRLVGGRLFAEAMLGDCAMAVSTAVGDLPEGERLLLLGHELGHLRLDHWTALRSLYEHHIPGTVEPARTDAVAGTLGRDAHALSHRHEFEADAYGYQIAMRLGYGLDTAFGLLTRQGVQTDGATHPGTRRRLAQMRSLDAQRARQLAGDAPDTVETDVAARPQPQAVP
ncbi:M48 family metalloprotease [Pseudaquabacterium rugosum]|uniref:M48 family metalloprotease n=1 Tax=Pseudaquabacterium rugosum TaxID=2984194 RepID=A0ABU9BD14_9BURK